MLHIDYDNFRIVGIIDNQIIYMSSRILEKYHYIKRESKMKGNVQIKYSFRTSFFISNNRLHLDAPTTIFTFTWHSNNIGNKER